MPNTTYGTPYAQSSDLVSNWPGVSLNIADRIDDVSFKGNGLNDQTGTTYTLVLTDAGKTVTLNNASAVTVTIPTNASVAYETGSCIYFTNKGAGVVTISPAGGVTLNNSSTLAQNASCFIQKLETNTWVMVTAPAAGLTLITSSTFSAVSSVSVNNCFTSTYENYQIVLFVEPSATNEELNLRYRTSGTDNTSSTYATREQVLLNSSVNGNVNTITANRHSLAYGSSGYKNIKVIHVGGPQATSQTSYSMGPTFNYVNPNIYMGLCAGLFTSTTSFDGFSIYPTSGTITGTLRVYGYRNS